MPAVRERSPTYNGPPQSTLPDPRYPPSRTGTPAQPNGQPLGLPSSPRTSPTSPRLPFGAPPRSGPSPAPPGNRGGPSPAPPGNRGGPAPPMEESATTTTGGIPPPRPGMPPQRGPSPPSNQGGPQGMRAGMPPGPQGMRPGMGPPGPRADGPQGRMAPPPPLGSLPTRTASPFILPPGTPGGPNRSYTPQLSPALTNFPPGQVISENDIDTKTGGEAGMAGVGRRGFAAAARAAMFAMPPKPSGARDDASYLSSNAPPHSPTSPLSQTYFPALQVPESENDNMARDLPKLPSKIDTSVNNLTIANEKTPVGDKDKTPLAAAPATPASPFGIRLPLFEKLKNMIPGSSPSSAEATPTKPEPEPLPTTLTRDNSKASNASSSDGSDLTRLRSTVSSSSTSSSHPRVPIDRGPISPISPTNESEYSGLAYARSDEDDDDDGSRSRGSYRSSRSRKRSSPPPPPLPPGAAALARQLSSGTTTTTSSGRLGYSPESPESRRGGIPIVNGARPRHARNDSGASSSYSSASSYENPRRERASSAAIAQALGLSRTPSKELANGGPGRPL
ncbi:hypothetical protein BKA70DRAFT_1439211 [Coprinopsis sp. MPI-PUGE-AT-0042]|nr:hypothetical protein BKA70DRAFT_1439211 [Coprinopsis sp. MPI-PUGE-AT-0042]